MSPEGISGNAWDPVLQAAHDLAADYEGRDGSRGIAALARHMGVDPRVLANELNPDNDHHKLGLNRAVVLSHAADDDRILRAFAAARNAVVIHLPDKRRPSADDLFRALAEWHGFLGMTNQAIREAATDARITREEYQAIRAKGMDHMARFFELLETLERHVEAPDA